MLVKSCSPFNDMFHVQRFTALDSTNEYIKNHILQLQDLDVIWALDQTHGRGRFDRVWHSGHDLTFSILFHRTNISHAILAPLAVVFALERYQVSTQIKWPNDILLQGKKCGGILVERIYESATSYYDIVGIGLNFTDSYGASLAHKAIPLPDPLNQEDVLMQILAMYQMLLRMDQASIFRQYRNYNVLIGASIKWQGKTAYIKDMLEHGELVLEIGEETMIIQSGEITLETWYEKGGTV